MMNTQKSPPTIPDPYYGRILTGDFSPALQARVSVFIQGMRAFDDVGGPAIPYIAAWQGREKIIWYEFVGRRFVEMLGCDYPRAARMFRESIIERRIYRYGDEGQRIREDILDGNAVRGQRTDLRETVKRQGIEEAVYKSAPVGRPVVWLKDQAVVVAHEADGVYISMGCLTPVTKEMEAEEHLRRTREALRESERKYRHLAIHDNLTGLYNTRYLYQSLADLISESTARSRPFALIFMDIDDFKQVVDTHGHLNASRALQEVAGTIESVLEEPAYGVAYGGDEFVVVLPGSTKEAALASAEILRQRIRAAVYLQMVGLQVKLKASFGVSAFPDDAANLNEVLALADQAMFAVKKRGKDSVSG